MRVSGIIRIMVLSVAKNIVRKKLSFKDELGFLLIVNEDILCIIKY